MSKRPLGEQNLIGHLVEQLGFLEDSAKAFDAGREGEAKRLAVTLRVLLHDTPRSRSLLDQLGRKRVPFWDLAAPDSPGNLLPHGGLIGMRLGPGGARYMALLDDVPFGRQVPFDTWWTAPVFRDNDGATLSRRDVLLTAANQDGGAHVDPALDERYARFAHDNALGWMYSDGESERPMEGAVRAGIRQIAHEVLRTLLPAYRMGRAGIDGPASAPPPTAPRQLLLSDIVVPEVGRNEPCPCGSGAKYKKCHGA